MNCSRDCRYLGWGIYTAVITYYNHSRFLLRPSCPAEDCSTARRTGRRSRLPKKAVHHNRLSLCCRRPWLCNCLVSVSFSNWRVQAPLSELRPLISDLTPWHVDNAISNFRSLLVTWDHAVKPIIYRAYIRKSSVLKNRKRLVYTGELPLEWIDPCRHMYSWFTGRD